MVIIRTWFMENIYSRMADTLNCFKMKILHRIWQFQACGITVNYANYKRNSISNHIKIRLLQWAEHVQCMPPYRIPKKLLGKGKDQWVNLGHTGETTWRRMLWYFLDLAIRKGWLEEEASGVQDSIWAAAPLTMRMGPSVRTGHLANDVVIHNIIVNNTKSILCYEITYSVNNSE